MIQPLNGNGPAIVAEGVVRSFGPNRALDGFDVSLPSGTVVALVGPNGAGKTTLLLILAGLLAPDRGRVRIAGVDPSSDPLEVHRLVGWMPDFFGVYDDLTPIEYLELFGALFRLSVPARSARARELLDAVGLNALAETPVHGLSRGQKQKLGLARALLHEPSVLLLDEPASGLDPRARFELRELVRRQAAAGVTVVVSSHILGELEEMSDLVVFVERGRCRGVHALAALPRSGTRRWRLRALGDLRPHLETSAAVSWLGDGGAIVEVEVEGEGEAAALIARLVSRGVRIVEAAPQDGGLEGAFLSLGDGEERA